MVRGFPPGAAPGTRWNGTNGNTVLLARMIRDEPGGDAASVLRFMARGARGNTS
jgi:hypothetical protein